MAYEEKDRGERKGTRVPFGETDKGTGFAERLREITEVKGIRGLCKETGISYGAMQKYLAGTAAPKLDSLLAIADATGADMNWLIKGDKVQPATKQQQLDASIDFIINALSMLEASEKQVLAKILAKKGVDIILHLLNEDNIALLQLPDLVKANIIETHIRPNPPKGEELSPQEGKKICAGREKEDEGRVSLQEKHAS